MTEFLVQDSTITAIADAIRKKEGTTESIPGDELASRITALPEPDVITNSQTIEVVAHDQIKIGDTVYTVEGMSDIYADAGTTALNDYVRTAAFSPDGTTLVLGGAFSGYAKVYSVSGTMITYISDIYADAGTTALSNIVNTAAFSPDGTTLVLGGYFSGCGKVYSVSGQTITYISDIYANAGTTALSSSVETAAFSPDGTTLVLGGYFSGYSKVYSVSDQTITYVSDIYADTGTTALSDFVWTAAFSPDGTTLVLGGGFSGKAKVYSVSGATITYVSDIYADTGTTALSDAVAAAAFSPDGTTLVLDGNFSGKAKVYSVSGITITYVSDIYADDSFTAFSSYLYTAAFSPGGTTLVLGGFYSGYVYSVSGQTFTYVSDIYADTASTALGATVYTAAFSPDGTTLVLGGYFSGKAKVYPIDGTEIEYLPTAYLAENGDFTDLPYGCYLGFSKSDAAIGENVTVRTIGKYMVNVDAIVNEEIDTVLEASY